VRQVGSGKAEPYFAGGIHWLSNLCSGGVTHTCGGTCVWLPDRILRACPAGAVRPCV